MPHLDMGLLDQSLTQLNARRTTPVPRHQALNQHTPQIVDKKHLYSVKQLHHAPEPLSPSFGNFSDDDAILMQWLKHSLLAVSAVCIWYLVYRWRHRQKHLVCAALHGEDDSTLATTKDDPNVPLRPAKNKQWKFLSRDDLESADRSNIRRLAISVIGLYFVAVVSYYTWECQWQVLDAIYFAVTTLTTVGYGDLHPTSTTGKLVTCGTIIVACSIIATALGETISVLVETEEKVMEAAPSKSPLLEAATAILLLLIIIGFGAVPYSIIEGSNMVDAIYWATVTVTTVGFGDQYPASPLGRAFAIIYILVGTPLAVNALSLIAQLPIRARRERQEAIIEQQFGKALLKGEYSALVKKLQKLHMKKPGISSVSKAQFTLALLVNAGKISEQDIQHCSDAFDALDVGGDMELGVDDIQDLSDNGSSKPDGDA